MQTDMQPSSDEGAPQSSPEPPVEYWLDPDAQQEPSTSLPDMTLKNFEFWSDLSWDSMRQRWACMGHIPTKTRFAVMQLRSSIAEKASAGPKDDMARIAAQKCFFFLDRVLFHRNGQRRGGKRGQKGMTE